MKKWIMLILLTIITVPIGYGICCEKTKDCIIAETCQDAACGNCSIIVYNRTGAVKIAQSNMKIENSYLYTYNASKTLPKYEIYPYAINCTNNKICKGDCQVEIKQECEEQEGMTTGIILFLLVFNIGLFITPVFVKHFTKNPVSNYVVRKMIIMAGILVLWFNSLIIPAVSIRLRPWN